jgi:uncharacterized protein YndB with AHSA1/START domain
MNGETKQPGTEPAAENFKISRTFDAPRQRLFDAWTQPERLGKWMSPKGFSTLRNSMDFRPGGTYHYGLGGPNNSSMWGKWTFREITAPERLVFVSSFSDENGGMSRHPMSATWPAEMLSTITFDEVSGNKTNVTVEWLPINASEEEWTTFRGAQAGMQQGWTGTFGQLEEYLKQPSEQA